MSRRKAALLPSALVLLAAGCAGGLEEDYGRVRGSSLNGTSAVAELFRQRGDKVLVARHLSEDVYDGADTIVRFAPYPGVPDSRESDWYIDWLWDDPSHRLIYVPRDYEADVDYWSAVLDQLPPDAQPGARARAESLLRQARDAEKKDRPPGAESPADLEGWFSIEPAEGTAESVVSLDGPWSAGIEPWRARLPRNDILTLDDPESGRVLLGAGPSALAIEADTSDGKVLVVANGSFLLNGALLNAARRPLAKRVVDWASEGLDGGARTVVFVEGESPWEEPEKSSGMPSGFSLLRRRTHLRWVVAHMIVFGLLACLAAAVRLGRPRPAPASGADRPAAHAEALGDLLRRTRDTRAAADMLEAYRRWRRRGGENPG